MTRAEIIAKWSAMSPRERDAWVAEAVFGFIVSRERRLNGLIYAFGSGGYNDICPAYTTDIAAAWTVAERLNIDHYVKIERIAGDVNVTGNYVCEIGGFIGWGAAPEAICLAAIIAKISSEVSA